MSTHSAPVIKINLEKHPNADTLSIVKIDSFQCLVRTQDWNDGELACYIPPDSIVDCSIPEFSFLGEGKSRVKTKRLRGIWSMGLLVKVPDWAKEGDNLYDHFKVEHYEPELNLMMSGNCRKTPSHYTQLSKYDIENGRSSRYQRCFTEGEIVWVSEKLHGANCSVVFTDGDIQVHSRTQWPDKSEDNLFWRAIEQSQAVVEYCRANPNHLVYGEVYGQVQKGFNYDITSGVGFRVFDILKPDYTYMDVDELLSTCYDYSIRTVPTVGHIPFNMDRILSLCEGSSMLNGKCIREGIVVKPLKNRYDYNIGRIVMKIVNPAFLERN